LVWGGLFMSFLDETGNNSEINKIKKDVNVLVKGIREEFEDHLDSINKNTEEISYHFDYLKHIESRIDKFEEKLENLQMQFSRFSGIHLVEDTDFSDVKLDEEEKRIFLFLYTCPSDKLISYKDVAKSLRISEFLVRGYVTNLIEKGIPVRKRCVNNEVLLELDSRFKELQAKKNIIKVDQKTVDVFF